MENVPAWVKQRLTEEYSDRLVRTILVGSRAKGIHRADSDWDIVAVVEGEPSLFREGRDPEIIIGRKHGWAAPDGNKVEVFVLPPEDLFNSRITNDRFVREGLECGHDL